MSYDHRCLQLAAFFFQDDHDHLLTINDMHDCAQCIQDAIESFLDGMPVRQPEYMTTSDDVDDQ